MIKGFDLVVDIQICMMIVIFVLSIRYALAEERTLTSYSIMPALYSVWSGILLYYFSHFFFLASLWFLLGVFLTVGMVVFFRRSDLISLLSAQQKTGILSADILLAFQSPSCYHYLLGHSRSGISVSVHRGFVGLQ
jgi:hypothetical protein